MTKSFALGALFGGGAQGQFAMENFLRVFGATMACDSEAILSGMGRERSKRTWVTICHILGCSQTSPKPTLDHIMQRGKGASA